MSIESALVRGRVAAAQRMTDTCTTRRQTGTTYDDTTGATTPTWTAGYAGPCRVRQPSAGGSRATVGEADVILQRPEVHLPMTAALLSPGDEVTLTGSVSDPLSIGRVFRVHAVPVHSQATARRYEVIERLS